jgi:hypothetical protein
LYFKGFGIACKFDSSNDCGYAAMSGSKTKWLVKESHSFILNGTEMTGMRLFKLYFD